MDTLRNLCFCCLSYFLGLTILLLLITCSCNETPKNNIQTLNNDASKTLPKKTELYIKLENVIGERDNLNAQTVRVKYDHYFKSSKNYKGYYINTIIDSIVKANNFDTSNALVVFECADGYKPIMNLSKIFGNTKGYIVFKDLDNNIINNWADSIYEKFKPYYLVWDDVKKEDNSFMWPYGLIGLRLISTDIEYKTIYPSKNLSLLKGFNLFQSNCLKCHSINKVGGSMGPEFNIPKNITEYWKEEDIISFAKSPNSYRYNSHMPPMTTITDLEFNAIILYLKYMKDNKADK